MNQIINLFILFISVSTLRGIKPNPSYIPTVYTLQSRYSFQIKYNIISKLHRESTNADVEHQHPAKT